MIHPLSKHYWNKFVSSDHISAVELLSTQHDVKYLIHETG